jgi:F-type H+-transporting ATPase subunit alpha
VIFAGTNAYLDDLPVELCRTFEAELYRFADNAHPEILNEIREKKVLSDELKGKIHDAMKEFKQKFVADHVKTEKK